MTDEDLDSISRQVPVASADGSYPEGPPLHLWKPELSGEIDIVIRQDGTWYHEGDAIQRPALVRLFSSILRREADGHYYLVTPVEKWRIRVETLPLVIVDFDIAGEGAPDQRLVVTTNTGRSYAVGKQYPLYFPAPEEGAPEDIPAIGLDHGLAALFNRAAWYRLVEVAELREGIPGIASEQVFFPITR